MIVSNHCSWIDILVHMSHFFPAFVARHGTKNMMLIGLIRCASSCQAHDDKAHPFALSCMLCASLDCLHIDSCLRNTKPTELFACW